MKTSPEGIRRIHKSELYKAVAYLCPAGKPTIGYGTTKGVTHADVGVRTINKAEAERLAALDLQDFEAAINRLVTVRPTQNQFDALSELVYNIGETQFARSTVLKAHNRGDFAAASRAFGLFNKHLDPATGKLKVSNGLVNRRAREAAVYLSDLPVAVPYSVPEPATQTVAPESKMSASPINRASVIAGASAVAAGATELTSAVNAVKTGAASLGDWLVPALMLAVLLACIFIIWQRIQQRRGGWA